MSVVVIAIIQGQCDGKHGVLIIVYISSIFISITSVLYFIIRNARDIENAAVVQWTHRHIKAFRVRLLILVILLAIALVTSPKTPVSPTPEAHLRWASQTL